MIFPKKFEILILYEFKLGYDAVAAGQNTNVVFGMVKFVKDIIHNIIYIFLINSFFNPH